MELYEMKAFLLLASELHFKKASFRMHLSQPAFSRLIQRLEEKCGGALFVRNRRKVFLTEAGRTLLPLAERIVRETQTALDRMHEVNEGKAGALRIGFGIASVCDILPRAILRFRKAFPLVELSMRDMSTPSQIAMLQRGEIDLGIVRFPVLQPGLDGFPLFDERLVLASSVSFPFHSRQGLAGLSDAPFVILPRNVSTTFHDHVMAVCRSAGFSPRVVQEAGELFTILNLVRAGLGVSLVPKSASKMNVPGVNYHNIEGEVAQWMIGPVWKMDSEKRILITRFCDVLKAVVRK